MSYINTPAGSKRPTPVLISTDFCEDADDLYDIRALTTAHKQGRIVILGVLVDTRATNGDTVAALDAMLKADGLPNLPIGVGTVGQCGSRPSGYCAAITAAFAYDRTTATAPDAVTLARTLLAGRLSADVVVVGLGLAGVLSALLSSAADGASALNGSQLLSASVKRLVYLAGKFPTDPTFVEYNFAQILGGGPMTNICNNWPTPITFGGYETSIGNTTGSIKDHMPTTDVMAVGLAASGYPNGKNIWPMTALTAIADGDANAAGYGTIKGTCSVHASGYAIFTEGAGKHEYTVDEPFYAALTASAAIAATSLSVNRRLLDGTYTLNVGSLSETVVVSNCVKTGTNAYTATVGALTKAHASGVSVIGRDVAGVTAAMTALMNPRAPVVADVQTWTPANAAHPPDVWLRGEDLAALGDGTQIASWTDISGAGRNFTQATAGRRPLAKQTASGKWVARFDGTDDSLDNADPVLYSGVNNVTVFIVATSTAGGGFRTMIASVASMTAHTSPFFGFCLARINDDIGERAAGGLINKLLINGSTALAGWQNVNVYEVDTFEPYCIRRNGLPLAWNLGLGGAGSTGGIRMGADGANGNAFVGDVYEMIFYVSAVPESQKKLIRHYLRSKYATV